MKIFKKILSIFFISLGVIFLIIIIAGSYIWIADPFNLKTILPKGVSPISAVKVLTGSSEIKIDNVDKNPLLTEEQEAQLEAIGIEPADLPSEITPEIEECVTQKLGAKRAAELAEGSSPTAADFLKAGSCLN